jgi:hypothetical protein
LLVVIPDVPLSEDALERAVAHGIAQDLVDLIASAVFSGAVMTM